PLFRSDDAAGQSPPDEVRRGRPDVGCLDARQVVEVVLHGAGSWLPRLRAHQLAPENSDRRSTIRRANRLTARVITNSTRPAAMSSDNRRPAASGEFRAISEGIVWLPLPIRFQENGPGDRMMATAIVSPSARPSPSIVPPITPGAPKGRTAVRIISHRVAPSARAASS